MPEMSIGATAHITAVRRRIGAQGQQGIDFGQRETEVLSMISDSTARTRVRVQHVTGKGGLHMLRIPSTGRVDANQPFISIYQQ